MPPCNKPKGWRARSDIGIRSTMCSASTDTISTPRASAAVFGSNARSCSMETIRVEFTSYRSFEVCRPVAPSRRQQFSIRVRQTRKHRDFQKACAAHDDERQLCGSLAVVSHQLLDFVLLDSQTKRFRYQEMLELFPSEIRHAISKMVNMYDSAGDGAVRQKFTFGSPEPDGILNYRTKLRGPHALG